MAQQWRNRHHRRRQLPSAKRNDTTHQLRLHLDEPGLLLGLRHRERRNGFLRRWLQRPRRRDLRPRMDERRHQHLQFRPEQHPSGCTLRIPRSNRLGYSDCFVCGRIRVYDRPALQQPPNRFRHDLLRYESPFIDLNLPVG